MPCALARHRLGGHGLRDLVGVKLGRRVADRVHGDPQDAGWPLATASSPARYPVTARSRPSLSRGATLGNSSVRPVRFERTTFSFEGAWGNSE